MSRPALRIVPDAPKLSALRERKEAARAELVRAFIAGDDAAEIRAKGVLREWCDARGHRDRRRR